MKYPFSQSGLTGNEYVDWTSDSSARSGHCPGLSGLVIRSALLAWCAIVCWPVAAGQAQEYWQTGTDFSKARRAIVGVSWREAPLRETLHRFARRQGVAIFLDRRVDPGQLVEFSSSGKTVEQTLLALLDSLNLAGLRVDNRFYYVGPRDKVAELVFRRQQLLTRIRQLPVGAQTQWLSKAELNIEHLSSPASLLERTLGNSDVQVDGKRPRHDLWATTSLPDLSFLDRLIVLTYGFDLWIEIAADGTRASLVPAPEMSAVELNHPGKIPGTDLKRIQSRFADANIEVSRGKTRVRGKPLVQYEVRRAIDGFKAANASKSTNSQSHGAIVKLDFSTRGNKVPIVKVLENIARNREVQLKYDQSLKTILDQRVQLALDDVTYEELIEKTLESTGLKFQLDERELVITR